MSIFTKAMRRAWPSLLGGLMLLTGLAHAGTVTYVYTDPQGTPLAEADASGAITATFDYAPYGSQALGTPPDGPGYTGHVNDPDTGLVYMQARYYDPAVGRFLSTDPINPAAGNLYNFNRYAYASNNPIVNMDPDGRDTVGENIDENAQASADAGNKVATFAWAFAGVAWNLLGAESVSQVADKGAGAGAGNIAMAGISIATLGKGEEAVTVAKDVEQGVASVAKDILKDGDSLPTSKALDAASEHLGSGYKEVASGVFKSSDGTKVVRMTDSDLAKTGNHAGAPHMNFETGKTVIKPNGKESFISETNKHIFLPEEK